MTDSNFPLHALIFILSFIFTSLFEKLLIPHLSIKAAQPIYEEGPSWHLKKKGTPTMGGLAFLIAISFTLLLSSFLLLLKTEKTAAISLTICLVYAFSNSLIGVIDDLKKLRKKENAGLTPGQKLVLQFLCAALFIAARQIFLKEGSSLHFSFGEIELGLWYYPLSVFLLLGITNCANLTDGVDGLASSVAFAIGVSLYFISSSLSSEVSFISAALIGGTVGFLIFNIHPARIFMGDTGSLFFGALVASSAFALKNPMIVIFIGGVYVIEGISVCLQVLYYKACKKRLFKMAPLHHHLEKCGWSENKICIGAIILTFVFSIPVYIFYLP